MLTFKGKYTTADVMIDEIDATTISQIYEFINNCSFVRPIKIMPDTHSGKGAVIGFTMPMANNIIPNVVGVDIACGMLSVRMDPTILNAVDLLELDRAIRAKVPMGGEVHSSSNINMEKDFNFDLVQRNARVFTEKFNKRYYGEYRCPKIDYDWFLALCERVSIRKKAKNFATYVENSIGTLGGGNHFIEIGIDEHGYIWITIHSGSRNLGLRIATYWQDIAAKDLESTNAVNRAFKFDHIRQNYSKERWQELFQDVKNNAPPVPKGLEPLYDKHMYGYLIDTIFAHQYAITNRSVILDIIMKKLSGGDGGRIFEGITTVHNYIDYDDFIIRKGAVSSYTGEKFILPFNMEDGMLICEGKGNPDWNFSAPHGAGRLYSRTVAKIKCNVEEARASMEAKGIYTSVLPSDELRDAYKPAEVIEQAIEPTAKILHRIKPIMNLKAGDPEE